MGMLSDLSKIPVCNSFKAKQFYNQLCYEVDINNIFEKDSLISNNFKLGLSFLVDTNFNRQNSNTRRSNIASKESLGKKSHLFNVIQNIRFFIYT